MNVLRKFAGFLCIVIMSLGISLWLGLMMLHVTLLDRTAMKEWLQKSGVYGRALTSVVQVDKSGADDALLPQEVTVAALQRTFPPAYVQQGAEQALDATYDWLEGTKPAITFTIPLQDRRAEFVDNMVAALEPHMAKLPTCTAVQAGACITPGMTPASMAREIAERATVGDVFLGKPITEQSFTMASPPNSRWLRDFVANLTTIAWLSLMVAVLAAMAYVFLHADRLRGLRYVGRRITLGSAITLVGGFIMMFIGSSAQLAGMLGAADPQQVAIFNAMINPFLQVAVPDIGRWLAIFSSILILIGASIWIIASVLIRRKRARIQAAPLKPVDVINTMPGPTPPPVEPPANLPQ